MGPNLEHRDIEQAGAVTLSISELQLQSNERMPRHKVKRIVANCAAEIVLFFPKIVVRLGLSKLNEWCLPIFCRLVMRTVLWFQTRIRASMSRSEWRINDENHLDSA